MATNGDDPYFIVRDDVNESIDKLQVLVHKYRSKKSSAASDDAELADISKDLRNSIRSIEWDIEDLEETVSIVEKNPFKFNLTIGEVSQRKQFIAHVKNTIQTIKNNAYNQNGAQKSKAEKQSLLSGSGKGSSYTQSTLSSGEPSGSEARSTSSALEANRQYLEETKQQQQLLIQAQDEQIDNIGASVKVLKNISSHIGNELEEQAVLLDDFGYEMESTGSKMDGTMKKIAKVTRMSNDRRQWCAIGILIVIVIILIILISVL